MAQPSTSATNCNATRDTSHIDQRRSNKRTPEPSTVDSSVKRQRTDPTLDVNRTYKASGVKRALHGIIYQSKLLMLFVDRAIREKYDCRLATEMDAAEKFDDVVLRYNDKSMGPGEWKFRFLQAKHKNNEENSKITVKDLTANDKSDHLFSLFKYFVSFCKIKQNPSLSDCIFEDFTIITNNHFDDKSSECFTSVKFHDDPILYFQRTRHPDFIGEKFEIKQNFLIPFKTLFKFLLLTKVHSIWYKLDIKMSPTVNQNMQNLIQKHSKIVALQTEEEEGVNKLIEMVEEDHKNIYENSVDESRLPKSDKLTIEMALHDSDFETNFSDFCGKFRFVTKFWNENQLSKKIVSDKLAKEFRLLNADLVGDSFEKEMLDFLKSNDKGQASFYSWQKGENLFSKLKDQVKTLMVAGLSKSLPIKLRNYNIQFEEKTLGTLTKFLANRTTQVLHINTTTTLLSAIKVLQELKTIETYENHDSYIFMRLKYLLSKELREFVLDDFGVEKASNLLILECQDKQQDERNCSHLLSELPEQLECLSTKIVVIERGKRFVSKIRLPAEKIETISDDSISFEHLTTKSKDILLQTNVNFQGKDVKLEGLFDTAMFLMDQACLEFLVKRSTISIGDEKAFTSVGYVEDCYIDRIFCLNNGNNDHNNILDENDLIESGDKIRTIIVANPAGMGKSSTLTKIARRMKLFYENVWILRINLSDYAIDNNDPRSLHCITFEDTDTEGAIDFMVKIAVPSDSENQRVEFERKFLRLCLTANVGGNGMQIPKIVMLFDGFDEISPTFKQNTTKLIKALQSTAVAQLWITSRPEEEQHLSEALNSPIYLLEPFSRNDQIDFMVKFFKWHLKHYRNDSSGTIQSRSYGDILQNLKDMELQNVIIQKSYRNVSLLKDSIDQIIRIFPTGPNPEHDLERLKNAIDSLDFTDYASELIETWIASDISDDGSFTSIPLHLRMWTDVIAQKKIQLPRFFGSSKLFELFIKMKLDVIHRKGSINTENESNKTLVEMFHKSLPAKLKEMAVTLIFPNVENLPHIDYRKKIQLEEWKNIFLKTGLVVLRDGQFRFVHLNFAEFLVGEYLKENIKNEQVQNLLVHEIFMNERQRYESILTFLDSQLEDDGRDAEVPQMANVLRNFQNKYTIFRDLIRSKHGAILKFLMENIRHDKLVVQEVFLHSSLSYALFKNEVIGEFILKYYIELIDNGCLKPSFSNLKNLFCTTLEQLAPPHIASYLLDSLETYFGDEYPKQFLFEMDCTKHSKSVLHLASVHGYVQIVQRLVETAIEHLKSYEQKYFYFLSIATAIKSNLDNKAIIKVLFRGAFESIEDRTSIEDLAIFCVYSFNRFTLEEEELDEALDCLIKAFHGDNDQLGVVVNEILTKIKINFHKVREKRDELGGAIKEDKLDKAKIILDESKVFIRELVMATTKVPFKWGVFYLTPLHEAAKQGRVEIVLQLLESLRYYPRILEIVILSDGNGWWRTALALAIDEGHTETMASLLNFVKDEPGLGLRTFEKIISKQVIELATNTKGNDVKKKLWELIECVNQPELQQRRHVVRLHRSVVNCNELVKKQKIDLFDIVKSGKKEILLNSLKCKTEPQLLRDILLYATSFDGEKEKSLFDISPSNDITFVLLDWIKDHSSDALVSLLKELVEKNSFLGIDTEFLDWVRLNTESTTLRELILTCRRNGDTALKRQFSKGNDISSYLAWIGRHLDPATIEKLILSTDKWSGKTFLNFIDNRIKYKPKKKNLTDLLEFVKKYQNLRVKLLFQFERSNILVLNRLEDQSKSYDSSESEDGLWDPEVDSTEKNEIRDILMKEYNEIVKSVLNGSTALEDFTLGQLQKFRYYIYEFYDGKDEAKIKRRLIEFKNPMYEEE